jgi:hypothetical protein
VSGRRRRGGSHGSSASTTRENLFAIALRDEQRCARGRSEPQRGVDGDHRRASGVHGLDDLAALDALQVDGGDAEVAMSELALDDDQWHAFASHLDGVGVPELMWREPAPHSGRVGGAPQLGRAAAEDPCRPRVAPLMTQSSGPTGSSRRMSSHG